ncbi:YceI family protein [Yeosuana sp. MJ-SS3]|uniref:YceI family protein n=1 Tax=Gilvirhabdus luticola TaxID=3079858 RepID=A0ABU3U7R6_9FLAO|nr:YceI family protein [Yeosuana sp. MJ-SS3]MDU8886430.1 YceI family protein [Yeosuana sp. MJ-SS3]
MKNIFYFILLFSLTSFAQNKYITRSGIIGFEASVPAFEEVKAKSNAATAIINTDNGEFAALVLVKSFRFKNALMEEHFNENYAESSQFPKASFKGNISGLDIHSDISSYNISGELTFHGVTKALEDIPLTITKADGKIIITGEFISKASDYDIEIPKIVSNKIAQDVAVSFEFNLEKQ